MPAKRHLGLVVFRIKGENELTESLLRRLNSSGRLHCVPSSLKGQYVIRFTVTSPRTTSLDIATDWALIQQACSQILGDDGPSPLHRAPLSLAEVRRRNPSFGTSLLLSNSPMTPKVMNASFVALFENGDAVKEFLDRNGSLRIACKDSPVLQRRLRGLVRGQRQFSLDSHIDLMVASAAGANGVETPAAIDENGESPEEHRCSKCGQVVAL